MLLALSQRHQYRIAHHLHSSCFTKPILEVTDVSIVYVDVLNKDISNALKQKSPDMDNAGLSKSVVYDGFSYKCGMIFIHGSLGGQPEFGEIIQIVILQEKPIFIVKELSGWCMEHYRAYDLKIPSSKEVELVEPQELSDTYQLADYKISLPVLDKIFPYLKGENSDWYY